VCGKCVEACPEGAITITFNDAVLEGVPRFDTVEAARKTDYFIFKTPVPYSYELNEEMLEQLRNEFEPSKIVTEFCKEAAGKKSEEIEEIAKAVFNEYGKNWMKKVLQLGEEYPDRTYEVIKETVDQTGDLFFPLIPQRFIEIAYLSTQEFLKLDIIENWAQRIVYQVPNCYMFRQLQEQCGDDVAELMPCKGACLTGLEALFKDLDLEVTIGMDAETAKDGICQFRISSI